MPIDLSLDQDQQALQRSARDFFERRCPTTLVRAVEAGDLGYVPAMWQEMADLGWLGITVPENYGGTGGTFLDAYALYEELGRSLVPSPHLDTVAVAAETVLAVGTEAQRQELLPAIASGTCIVSLAVVEPSGSFGPKGIALAATASGDDWVLSGTKLLVAHAPVADRFLVAARTSGAGTSEGITLFLVDADAAGLSWAPLPNIAGDALHALTLDDVAVPGSSVVGEVDGGWAPLSRTMTTAAVLQTSSIVGAARVVLDMTNRYAQDREQFGGPIGRYQAVQYMVTDVLIDMHRTDLLGRQAAYRIDAGKPFGREAAIAIAFGKRAAAHLHRQAHEVHAGVAFILDHDLTLYSRRSKYWENNLGDARYHEDQLAHEMRL